jgi:hypothetical protein
MHQIQLADDLYKEAERRSRVAGFASVDEFIADVLEQDFSEIQEDLDDRFTPEVNAYLNRVAAEMAAGGSLSVAEVVGHLDEARKEWRENQSS